MTHRGFLKVNGIEACRWRLSHYEQAGQRHRAKPVGGVGVEDAAMAASKEALFFADIIKANDGVR